MSIELDLTSEIEIDILWIGSENFDEMSFRGKEEIFEAASNTLHELKAEQMTGSIERDFCILGWSAGLC